jgi:hypothetical protein
MVKEIDQMDASTKEVSIAQKWSNVENGQYVPDWTWIVFNTFFI